MDRHDQLPKAEWLGEGDFEQWDVFVRTSIQASPFALSSWLTAYANHSPKHSFQVAVVRAANGSISAGAALLLARNRVGQLKAISPSYIPYNGLLFAPRKLSDRNKLYRAFHRETVALLSLIRTLDLTSIRFTHQPSVTDVRPFMWSGWHIRPAYTFLVDLNTWNGVESIARGHRQNFKRCKEAGYSFQAHDRLGTQTGTMIRLLEKTYTRQGFDTKRMDPRLGGIRDYEKYLLALDANGALRYYEVIGPDGQVASAQVAATGFNRDMYSWLQGTDPKYLSVGASTFLFVSMFDHWKMEGWDSFDFGGANTPKISDFKQAFNGLLVAGTETLWESPRLSARAIRIGGGLWHAAATAGRRLIRRPSTVLPGSDTVDE